MRPNERSGKITKSQHKMRIGLIAIDAHNSWSVPIGHYFGYFLFTFQFEGVSFTGEFIHLSADFTGRIRSRMQVDINATWEKLINIFNSQRCSGHKTWNPVAHNIIRKAYEYTSIHAGGSVVKMGTRNGTSHSFGLNLVKQGIHRIVEAHQSESVSIGTHRLRHFLRSI